MNNFMFKDSEIVANNILEKIYLNEISKKIIKNKSSCDIYLSISDLFDCIR